MEGQEGEQKFYKQKHDINIALLWQTEINNQLIKITNLDLMYPVDSPQKLKVKLDLTMDFLERATPYLSISDSKKYKEELFSFDVRKKVSVRRGAYSFGYEFNKELDLRLREIRIEILQLLRNVFTKIRDQEEEGL